MTSLPPQVALCVSLWSGQRFGRGNRGRLYLPTPSASVGDSGLVDAGAVGFLRNVMARLLQDLTSAMQAAPNLGDVVPVIVSAGGTGTTPAPPITRAIEQIAVGRVLDTQRRRRRSLEEYPVYATIAQAAGQPIS